MERTTMSAISFDQLLLRDNSLSQTRKHRRRTTRAIAFLYVILLLAFCQRQWRGFLWVLATNHPTIIDQTSFQWIPPSSVSKEKSSHLRHSSILNNSNNTTSEEDNAAAAPEQERILLVSFIFGRKAATKQYVRLFIESARHSGVDLVIIGDQTLPYELPPNVRNVVLSWDDFAYRVQERLFHGSLIDAAHELRQAKSFYKIVDFKPLFAHLFPEQVQDYDWWGHVDNDMILGNVRQFLPSPLSDYDVISGIPYEYTWGPFTLYRNTPAVHQLFQYAERPLGEIFAAKEVRFFDEWGGGGDRRQGKNYASTMAGILDHHRERLGIRWFGGGFNLVWDGFCTRKGLDTPCSMCELRRQESSSTHAHDGEQQQQLVKTTLQEDGTVQREDAGLCHFQDSKDRLERWSRKHPAVLSRLIKAGQYSIDFQKGISPIEADDESSIL